MATIQKYSARTILFTAGQVPSDAHGGVQHRGDFAAQARAVFGAIRALIEHRGGTRVEVSALAHPAYLIEIEAIAVI